MNCNCIICIRPGFESEWMLQQVHEDWHSMFSWIEESDNEELKTKLKTLKCVLKKLNCWDKNSSNY